MAKTGHQARSLRRLLVFRLLAFLFPLAVLTLGGAYFVTLHYANKAFDRGLARRAYALADQVEVVHGKPVVELPKSAHEILEFDPTDILYFRVIGPQGEHLGGDEDLPLPNSKNSHAAGRLWFYETELNSARVRVAAFNLSLKGTRAHGNVMILSGETTAKRTHLANEILLALLVPMMIVIGLTGYVVNLGVNISLRPIREIREAIANRNAHDLNPIELNGLPEEIEPLLAEMNSLMKDLRSLLDSRQQFLADAAHQLRTPLAGLRARIELAIRDHADSGNKKMLTDMLASLDRQSRLVQQLLTLSRAENVLTDFLVTEIELDELARNVTAEWAPLALQRNIELAFEPAGNNARVRGNVHAISEALANLLDNALRYCRAGDTVIVRSCLQNGQVCLAVSDDGPGVPEESLPKLFDRFYRVPGTSVEGCGLGLAIVAQVASSHDGWAQVSNNANGGLEVSLCFPVMRKLA